MMRLPLHSESSQEGKDSGSSTPSRVLSPPRASELRAWAGSRGWTRKPGAGGGGQGPETWVDHAGRIHMKLKHGSTKLGIHPDSQTPHVEFRDQAGQRVDLDGNPVTRRSPGNHTLIVFDT